MSVFLVDTNVLVYAYDPTDGRKRSQASAVVEKLEVSGKGCLSAQVLGEFYNTVTRKIPSPLTRREAERTVTNYARSWVVHDISVQTVLEAARAATRYELSYWDALICATAKINGLSYVLTEDLSTGTLIEGVRILDPFASDFAHEILD